MFSSAKISTTTTTHTPPIFAIDHSGFCCGHPLLTICFHGSFCFPSSIQCTGEKQNPQCFRTPSLTYQRSSYMLPKYIYDVCIHIDWDRHTGTERERDRERLIQVDWDKLWQRHTDRHREAEEDDIGGLRQSVTETHRHREAEEDDIGGLRQTVTETHTDIERQKRQLQVDWDKLWQRQTDRHREAEEADISRLRQTVTDTHRQREAEEADIGRLRQTVTESDKHREEERSWYK